MRTVLITALALALTLSFSIAQPDKTAETIKLVPPETARKLDPVELLITKGLAAYQAGKSAQALADLQQAIALIQEQLFQSLGAHFPEAPDGWKADKIKSQAMSMGSGQGSGSWTQISRTYTRVSDKIKVTLSLTNSSQLLASQQAAAEAYRNPMMMQMMNQDPNTTAELIDRDGWTGWKIIEKGSKAQIIAFSQLCLLSLDAGKADEEALDTIFNAIDLKALAEAQPKLPAAEKSK